MLRGLVVADTERFDGVRSVWGPSAVAASVGCSPVQVRMRACVRVPPWSVLHIEGMASAKSWGYVGKGDVCGRLEFASTMFPIVR